MFDMLNLLACGLTLACSQDPCFELSHAQVDHIVCSFRTDRNRVEVRHANESGKAYGSLFRYHQNLEVPPLMSMNGGMYHEDLSPVGLYVEQGRRDQRISTRGGFGNFHLLPNGVFWVKGNEIGVTETRSYISKRVAPDFATQSGPMLVIDGKLHPRFIEGSDSLKIRNGVGINQKGSRVTFAISKQPVNFWNFGTLFRDILEAENALFLDGTVSTIRSRNFKMRSWRSIGPIIAVFPNEP